MERIDLFRPALLRKTDSPGELVQFVRPAGGRSAPARKPLSVALVGNYAPRKCGIATFTADIVEQMAVHQPETRLDVFAMQDSASPVAHDAVHAEIERDDLSSCGDRRNRRR